MSTNEAVEPTADDIAVYEQLTGFTDHDIEIIALAVGVDKKKVYRMVDCIRFVKGQGWSIEASAGAAPLDVEVCREALARCVEALGFVAVNVPWDNVQEGVESMVIEALYPARALLSEGTDR